MPARRDPDRSRIEDALAALSAALSETGAPWMVIGGIAVIAHGVQRMTTDIDAVIAGDVVSVPAVLTALRRQEIVPRVAHPVEFAAANLVLLTRHVPTEVDLDLSFGWTVFEHEALAARARTRYGRVTAPMASVDDLLVFKAIAGRPRDIDDAVTLLTLYPGVDLGRVRRRVRELADLADAPELAVGLDRVVAAAAAAAAGARRPRRTARVKEATPAPRKPAARGRGPRPVRKPRPKPTPKR